MNPQRSVPTMDDNGFIAWDSHAIMCYLSDKYGKDDSLYPKDLRRRTVINQHLHFETGVLFARFRYLAFPLFMGKVDKMPAEMPVLLEKAYDLLNSYLKGKQWLAGDSYTLADISCVTSISSIQINPQGTVPLLEDNDCVICDSHAISGYLVNKYSKDDAL